MNCFRVTLVKLGIGWLAAGSRRVFIDVHMWKLLSATRRAKAFGIHKDNANDESDKQSKTLQLTMPLTTMKRKHKEIMKFSLRCTVKLVGSRKEIKRHFKIFIKVQETLVW